MSSNAISASQDFAALAAKLPSINVDVEFPCNCLHLPKSKLSRVVIHLNDEHNSSNIRYFNAKQEIDVWTRELIADWLDELHDSGIIDIEF